MKIGFHGVVQVVPGDYCLKVIQELVSLVSPVFFMGMLWGSSRSEKSHGDPQSSAMSELRDKVQRGSTGVSAMMEVGQIDVVLATEEVSDSDTVNTTRKGNGEDAG